MDVDLSIKAMIKQGSFKNQKELSNWASLSESYITKWKKQGYIPSEIIDKFEKEFGKLIHYKQEVINDNSTNKKIQIPNHLNFYISDKEIEILQAYRELEKDDQEIFYHKLKAAAAESRKKAKENSYNTLEEDVKSAV